MMTFSQCYVYNPERHDEIESVVKAIQKRLVREEDLSEEEIYYYVRALDENAEL
jgi:pyruvate dehydrogenase complex dehydrogenase (E1) component